MAAVVKVMKGSEEFRVTNKLFVQCRNEVFIYDKFIPYLKTFAARHNSSIATDEWVPKTYHCYYGKVPALSSIDECIIAMENMSVSGFRSGPRLTLDMAHLQLMLKTISEYHAIQYAMRIEGDPQLDVLKKELVTLRWKEPPGSVPNLFEVFYPPAFQRMFEYFDNHPEVYTNASMKEDIELMRKRFGEDPVALLELFREDDPKFSVILHGDYNRNNVLFQYESENSNRPIALRMIDFQEARYASPAIDLFFFFYMSTTAEFREQHWDDLLRFYHDGVWRHLKELLKCDNDSDARLQDYTYDKFLGHFSRFAFYGVMVTIQFLPWMDADPKELEPLAAEIVRDMKSELCRKYMLAVGGAASNLKVAQAVQHACNQGYLSFLRDL